MLCEYWDTLIRGELYYSPKGTFFVVEKSKLGDEPTVKLLNEASARSLMDEHAAGVIAENYARVFGEPEQG